PFAEAAVHAGLLWLRRGAPTCYPVPVTIIDSNQGESSASASPSESDDPLSAWAIGADADRVSLAPLAGKSAYQARLGVNTGGANGLFWFRKLAELGDGRWRMEPLPAGRDPPPAEIVELETDLLYPLLRGKDVRAWRAEPSAWMLLVQDPDRRVGIPVERMQKEFPCTLGYLERHERRLRDRAAYRRFFAAREAPFYSQFNVGAYSLAPWKVVWNRLGHRLVAAVIGSLDGKPILPQETHAFFPLTNPDEAHFLAALLNSSPCARALAAWGQRGGKSFATPGAIHRLALPKYLESEPRHCRLADLGRRAAEGEVETAELDQSVREMFGLT
ncbi:MAG TPA: hypothetical protein VNC50_08795, partial [Planctomycetia bacterium]|nr:hypothetical protein [Planctomycetia bacterium]